MTLAAIQLLVGVPYVWTLWLTGVRKAPKFSLSKVRDAVRLCSIFVFVGIVVIERLLAIRQYISPLFQGIDVSCLSKTRVYFLLGVALFVLPDMSVWCIIAMFVLASCLV